MADRDTVDFVTAFAVGAILGVGATLLLRTEPQPASARVMKELKPYGKKIRRTTKRAVAAGAGGAEAGLEILSDFRDEMRGMVDSARKELSRSMDRQVRDARKLLRKQARRLRG